MFVHTAPRCAETRSVTTDLFGARMRPSQKVGLRPSQDGAAELDVYERAYASRSQLRIQQSSSKGDAAQNRRLSA